VTQQADAASQKSQQVADNEMRRRLLTNWRAARFHCADAAIAQGVEFLRRIRGSETRE
jgi:hypothetical protein